jgi:hypothetical protein
MKRHTFIREWGPKLVLAGFGLIAALSIVSGCASPGPAALSPYSDPHELELEISGLTGTPATVYLWLPLVTPRTWVALAPDELAISATATGISGKANALAGLSLEHADSIIFAQDINGAAQGTWTSIGQSETTTLVIRARDQAQDRILRGLYRLNLRSPPDAETPVSIRLRLRSSVSLEGSVATPSLEAMANLADPSF